MQSSPTGAEPKDYAVNAMRLEASDADSDVQQVEGKGYDPTFDQRDMKRLGKRQELKASTHAKPR